MSFITSLFNYQRIQRRKLYFGITTLIGRWQAYLGGVKFGKNLRFYGNPFIQKSRNGILYIGNNCTFRSTPISNLIGINRPCILTVHDKAELRIGNNCGFSGTVIGCFGQIILEDGVRCGANTLITDSDWHLDDPRSAQPRPIYIEKNVWLGVNVTIMKGVRIGENSVIGAGSIVTKNIPSNVIAAGNPCQVIKPLT